MLILNILTDTCVQPVFLSLVHIHLKLLNDKDSCFWLSYCHCSVAKSCPTLGKPHGLQHARLPCPSLSPRVCSNSCPLSHTCHPTISSSVIPFSSCLLSFQASGSFPVSWFFASGGQNTGASASVLPVNIQG